MGTYLFHGVQTPATLAKLLEVPEDRAEAIEPIFKLLGGELLGYWYTLGGSDVYVLYELPDDITATGLIAKVTASGAFSAVSSTRLLTVSEMLPALGGAGQTAYRAPGRWE
jgi:uncharacterized protein with GYD domain